MTVPGQGSAGRSLTVPAGAGDVAAAPGPSTLVPQAAYRPGGVFALAALVGLLVVGAVFALVGTRRGAWLRARLAVHTGATRRTRRSSEQRFAGFAVILRGTERALGHLRPWKSVQGMLDRGDTPLRAAELFYICTGAGVVVGLFAAVAAASPLVILVAMAAGALVPVVVVWQRMRRRLAAFETQLPDLLITIAAALKAGHSFKQGLQAVVDEGQPPASAELKRVLTESGLGRPVDDSLAEMAARVGSNNFEFAITAVTIQRQVGGSLASLFDMVADTVRQRQQFARKIRSLTAMGRMSAYTLIGLPFFLMGAISVMNAGYLRSALPLFGRAQAPHPRARDDGDRLGNPQEDRLVQGVMPMLLILAAICLSASALAVGNVVTLPARTRRARIRSAATYGVVRGPSTERVRFQKRVVAPLVGSLAHGMLRLNPKQNLDSVSRLLMSAGMRTTSPQAFLASKAASGIAGLVLGIAVGASMSAGGAVVLGCILGAVGYILPAVIVTSRSRRRQAHLVAELPDALDLLAVSVEAGLGFDGAIAKLTRSTCTGR